MAPQVLNHQWENYKLYLFQLFTPFPYFLQNVSNVSDNFYIYNNNNSIDIDSICEKIMFLSQILDKVKSSDMSVN